MWKLIFHFLLAAAAGLGLGELVQASAQGCNGGGGGWSNGYNFSGQTYGTPFQFGNGNGYHFGGGYHQPFPRSGDFGYSGNYGYVPQYPPQISVSPQMPSFNSYNDFHLRYARGGPGILRPRLRLDVRSQNGFNCPR